MRVCPKCQVTKGDEQFAIDPTKASGRKSWCKACDREKARRYYAAHREERARYFARRRINR